MLKAAHQLGIHALGMSFIRGAFGVQEWDGESNESVYYEMFGMCDNGENGLCNGQVGEARCRDGLDMR